MSIAISAVRNPIMSRFFKVAEIFYKENGGANELQIYVRESDEEDVLEIINAAQFFISHKTIWDFRNVDQRFLFSYPCHHTGFFVAIEMHFPLHYFQLAFIKNHDFNKMESLPCNS